MKEKSQYACFILSMFMFFIGITCALLGFIFILAPLVLISSAGLIGLIFVIIGACFIVISIILFLLAIFT